MAHVYFSQRTGVNPAMDGLSLADTADLFKRVFGQLCDEGYFTEALGYVCVDAGAVEGTLKDVELEILLSVRKKQLWPISTMASWYSEDDLFDIVEFLYQHVSKPIDGTFHSYGSCGMHWHSFNKADGQSEYRNRVNKILSLYEKKYELSPQGEILLTAEPGFERLLVADVPTTNGTVKERIDAAVLRFRRHGSTLDDRRQAVRDLADALEYLRPQVKAFLTSKDDGDLFQIANGFGLRHLNDKQKTSYDVQLWLPWMFYFYLATLHVVLRKIERGEKGKLIT